MAQKQVSVYQHQHMDVAFMRHFIQHRERNIGLVMRPAQAIDMNCGWNRWNVWIMQIGKKNDLQE